MKKQIKIIEGFDKSKVEKEVNDFMKTYKISSIQVDSQKIGKKVLHIVNIIYDMR